MDCTSCLGIVKSIFFFIIFIAVWSYTMQEKLLKKKWNRHHPKYVFQLCYKDEIPSTVIAQPH